MAIPSRQSMEFLKTGPLMAITVLDMQHINIHDVLQYGNVAACLEEQPCTTKCFIICLVVNFLFVCLSLCLSVCVFVSVVSYYNINCAYKLQVASIDGQLASLAA